jgi:hypothetical protein
MGRCNFQEAARLLVAKRFKAIRRLLHRLEFISGVDGQRVVTHVGELISD